MADTREIAVSFHVNEADGGNGSEYKSGTLMIRASNIEGAENIPLDASLYEAAYALADFAESGGAAIAEERAAAQSASIAAQKVKIQEAKAIRQKIASGELMPGDDVEAQKQGIVDPPRGVKKV